MSDGHSSLKLVYSKQPIIGVTQAFRLVSAYVGDTFQKLSYLDETLAHIASHKKKKELIDKEIIIIHACVCEKFKKSKILNFHTLKYNKIKIIIVKFI